MRSLLQSDDGLRWTLPRSAREDMRVPGLLFADEYILETILEENALAQVANVATLPGIVGQSIAMPDIHWGYGFPIGGVAAFDTEEGILSPGGVGYDIACGVRLLVSPLSETELLPQLEPLLHALFAAIPSGVGAGGAFTLKHRELEAVLLQGARWVVNRGYGDRSDLERTEERGCFAGADPGGVSPKALERGAPQLGTLGSGNHFIEIQAVDEIFDEETARRFALRPGGVTVMIHCGSRGLGHQICDDAIKLMARAMRKYGIAVPDRQLCCAPLASDEGRAYLGAMRCAGNFALANRQLIAALAREVFSRFWPETPLSLLYDVCPNIAAIETHRVDGRPRELCVHRKGATRALPPGHPSLPPDFARTGQPVLIPGSMGTRSHVLVGTEHAARESFASTCHGAGRVMSRTGAKHATSGAEVRRVLSERGIRVVAHSERTLVEEAPRAYKDVDKVVEVVHRAGIARKIASLRPLGVVKG